jgi:hypothetical protein
MDTWLVWSLGDDVVSVSCLWLNMVVRFCGMFGHYTG